MIRYHTISIPAEWIEPVNWIEPQNWVELSVAEDGTEVVAHWQFPAHWEVPGYWIPMHQIDVQFTPEEETTRDVEEAADEIRITAIDAQKQEMVVLNSKLASGIITYDELIALLKLERGL